MSLLVTHRFQCQLTEVDVGSLTNQCRTYILMHLEEFPVGYLSLLPLSEREWLLQRLPIADVCLLEDTAFTNGIDMASYWRPPSELDKVEESDYFIKEWGRDKFAKAILYGEIASTIIGCLPGGFWFSFEHGREYIQIDYLIQFLYAVRKFPEGGLNFSFPLRYENKFYLCGQEFIMTEEIIDATVNCFRGELPKILNSVYLDDNVEFRHKYVSDFLCELRVLYVLGIEWIHSYVRSLDFVRDVLKEANHLRVLMLEGDDYTGCNSANEIRVSLNCFCSDLSSHPTFLTEFRVLKILACTPGYSVSQERLNELISAYLSAPTDHAQIVRFTGVKIESYKISSRPKFDQQHLQLKTIEFDNCRFVSECDAKHEAISHWLGQSINVVENKSMCSLQVSGTSRKRRYSEREAAAED